jgi:putative restriction endonuclease
VTWTRHAVHHPAHVPGGGFFAHSLILPVNLAWDAFGQANGAGTLAEVETRTGGYRRAPIGPLDHPAIGCILLAEPFFLPPDVRITVLPNFARSALQDKTHRTETDVGQALYTEVADRALRRPEQAKPHAGCPSSRCDRTCCS